MAGRCSWDKIVLSGKTNELSITMPSFQKRTNAQNKEQTIFKKRNSPSPNLLLKIFFLNRPKHFENNYQRFNFSEEELAYYSDCIPQQTVGDIVNDETVWNITGSE